MDGANNNGRSGGHGGGHGGADWIRSATERRVQDFSDQLRTVDDTSVPVPKLDWSVADLGRHVACLPRYWRARHDEGESFTLPDNFAAYSDAARAHLTETDPLLLADLVDREFEAFCDELDASEPQRWLYGVRTTPMNMYGLALSETTVHGLDLAAVTGAKQRRLERPEANAAVGGLLTTAPVFVDEAKALAQPDGVYHTRFRGGKDYTLTKTGGAMTIAEGRPNRADARLVADPETFLMASFGRVGQIQASLSGKMIAYGRKPWRLLGLQNITVDGV